MLEKIVQSPQRLRRFYGDVRGELKKVTWPSKKEVYSTTAVVVAAVFFFGFYLFGVDTLLRYIVDVVTDF